MERSDDFNSEIDFSNPLYSLYDLSFIEILIINELVKEANSSSSDKISILRHDLYKVINDLVKAHKKLSTSSFYRTLKKLQERGLVESKKSDDVNYRNAIEVYSTESATQLIGFMMHFIVQFNGQTNSTILDYLENELVKQLSKYVDVGRIKKLRIIDPSVRIDSPADLVASIIPDAIGIMRIMANVTLMNSWGASFLVNVLSTQQIFTGEQKEKDRSDLIIYPLYGENTKYKGKDYLQIISELTPLLAKDGFILFIHLDEIKSDHHYVDIFKSFLQFSNYYQTFDSEILIQEISSIGFEQIAKFSHRGISFVLVKN